MTLCTSIDRDVRVVIRRALSAIGRSLAQRERYQQTQTLSLCLVVAILAHNRLVFAP